jgi:predicted site-specific integrase-resolvase
MDKFVRTKEVAVALGLDEETIRAYARDGCIPYMETPGGRDDSTWRQ